MPAIDAMFFSQPDLLFLQDKANNATAEIIRSFFMFVGFSDFSNEISFLILSGNLAPPTCCCHLNLADGGFELVVFTK